MQTFILETIEQIAKKHNSFENVVLILPSQRAKVFVKEALQNEITVGFLPRILNIEELVTEISGLKKIDSIELLFHLYTIYKKNEPNPDNFDKFSTWAFTVIQDFNEIDQHLIDIQDIFAYIRDIQRLREWSVKGVFEETELMKNHYKFLKNLKAYYSDFYKFLVENKIGYQGILYREASKNIETYASEHKDKSFYFIGFNALNFAEEKLFQTLLNEGNTEIFWDIDKTFLDNYHQAGKFIRKYADKWHYYEKHKIKTSTNFTKDKHIQVIGASKNVTQVKYAGELLSKLDTYDNTAIVLADEGLLPIMLNSLPKTIDKINITMGYPLKDIPTTHLIFSIFNLFLTQEKLSKKEDNLFYYKSVVSLIKQAPIYKLLSTIDEELPNKIIDKITEDNLMFISCDFIKSCIKVSTNQYDKLIRLFDKFTTIDEFISRIINLIAVLKEDISPLEKEFLFRYHSIFIQLQNLQSQFGYFSDLKTLSLFFRQLINSESLSFKGEPLEGLQLMGMLETRVLDFKNIILISANEDILPANAMQNSFVPFDVKQHYGLPTYQEKDAIFSYHFFRLLQRAENVYILYNTETDTFGKGEKSRFITQLEMLKPNIKTTFVSPQVEASEIKKRVIKKDITVIERLKEIATNSYSGFSPSALTTYLYNPVKFYQQRVLGLKELDEVEETIAMNTMGTVVHDTLEELYKPFTKTQQYLTIKDIEDMQPKVEGLVQQYFAKHFKNGDITKGKNLLTYKVAIRFVMNFLKQEKHLLSDKTNRLKILKTEEKMTAYIQWEGIDYPIKISGTVDRVDELNGVIRIIDYKTGKVTPSDLKVTFIDEILDYKYSKAIQVMLYAYMYISENNYPNNGMEAGIISFKNLKEGFMKMNFSSKRGTVDGEITKERIEEFTNQMKGLLAEIFNENIPFEEPLNLPF